MIHGRVHIDIPTAGTLGGSSFATSSVFTVLESFSFSNPDCYESCDMLLPIELLGRVHIPHRHRVLVL